MKLKLLLIPFIFSVLLLGFSFNQDAYATTNLVANGSFEDSLTSWTVGGGGVDRLSTGWQASDGVWTIDVSAFGAGSVSQNIATVVGTTYDVTFDMSGNPTDAPDTKSLTVSAAGNSQTYTYTTPIGSTTSTLVYVPNTFSFTATSTTTTLTFTSNNNQANGPMLDNVAILADLESPVISTPGNITVSTDSGVATAVVSYSAPTATDNVGVISLVQTAGLPSGSAFPLGTTTNTFTATDAAGNSANASFTVTVNDNEDPMFAAGPLNLVANGSFEEPANFCTDNPPWTIVLGGNIQSGWTVTGDSVEWVCPSSFWTIPDGVQAIDLDGNAPGGLGQVLQTVPGVTYDVSFQMAGNIYCGDTIKDIEFIIGGQSQTYSWDSTGEVATSLNWETHTLSYSATGSSTQIQFNSLDNNQSCGPMIDDVVVQVGSGLDITVSTDSGVATAVVSYSAPTATDNVGVISLVQTAGLPSGSAFPLGTTTNTFTATDAAGNSANASFTVTVIDTESPVVSVSSETEEATGPSGAAVTFSSSATDNVDGAVSTTCDATSGDVFEITTTTVTCTATDAAGNTGSGTGTIIVQDTTAPDVTVPSDITLHATSPAGAEVTFSSSATDIVDGAVSTTCTPTSGDTFAIDTTEVICEATDVSSNTGSATFNVTIFNTAPVCSDVTPSNDSVWPPNHKYKSISIDGVTDADGDETIITIDSIQQDEAVDAKGSGKTAPDGEIDGDTANIRAERTGNGDGRIYEISFTADDGLGGVCSGSVTVGVPHDKKSTAVDSVVRFDSTLP